MRQDQLYSSNSVKTLKNIKYCAIILGILIVMAAIFIRIFHNKEDDPAGFLGLCILLTFVSITVATAAAVFQKKLQNAIDMKSEKE